MKKSILTIGFVIGVLTLITLSSCGGNDAKPPATPVESTGEQYQCPMKCTEELFNKPGTCPVCGMELEKVIKS